MVKVSFEAKPKKYRGFLAHKKDKQIAETAGKKVRVCAVKKIADIPIKERTVERIEKEISKCDNAGTKKKKVPDHLSQAHKNKIRNSLKGKSPKRKPAKANKAKTNKRRKSKK